MESIFRVNTPFVFTIFGASGDLAKLKIFPSLFALAEQNRFLKDFAIIGYSRTKMTDAQFRKIFEASVRKARKKHWGKHQEKVLTSLLKHVFYQTGGYDQQKDFTALKTRQEKIISTKKPLHIAYFSVPPVVFEPIIEHLSNVYRSDEDLRLVLEKPLGGDEHSARRLFHTVGRYFSEDQVYLLDHYLGKKAVRSILPLRHANRILNLMMKGREVANIQITASETIGVEERLGYFDSVGTLKDMVQSHLLQILALTTMSIPIDKSAKHVQHEKFAILSALDFIPKSHHVCLGQYKGYKGKSKKTPTFAALKFFINRESWYDVPIFLRTGKKLHEKHTYIVIELKKFEFQPPQHEPNRVIIELSPEEKIHIRLLDEDGVSSRMTEISTSQSIACEGDYCLPEHGLLFLDVIRGERTYFLSFAEILACWKLIDGVTDFLTQTKQKIEAYPARSKGPSGQANIMKGTGFSWYDPHG